MKKIYSKPEALVVNIKTTNNILLGSQIDVYSETVQDGLSREATFSDDLFDTGDVLDTDAMLNQNAF